MAEKRKPTPDLDQMPPFPHRRWLAGFLEAGASMKITIIRNWQNGHLTPQARPEIAYGDNDQNRIALLKKLLSSTDKPRQTMSTRYAVIRGDEAVSLAYSIRADAPSRQTIISAFIEWLQANFTEDRVEIAKRVVGRRVVDPVPQWAYERLITDSNFVGGVIDCRGRVVPHEHMDRQGFSSWIKPDLKINSVNFSLLESLRKRFGSHIETIGRRGDEKIIRGTEVTLKNDCYELIVGSRNAEDLLAWARPKLPLANSNK